MNVLQRGDRLVVSELSQPVVAYTGSGVVVDVGRLVDARGPQGVACRSSDWEPSDFETRV